MADNVKVRPSAHNNAVNVATNDYNGVHYPEYIIHGVTDGGVPTAVPVTGEGHLEVAIHEPRLPFGSIHTESIESVFQVDAVYGINSKLVTTETGHLTAGVSSASVTGTDNVFKCSTGTTALSYSVLQSRKRLRYRPGQGVIGRFAGLWDAGVVGSIVVAGFGTAESGFYFGYNGTEFGILHSTGGVREIQTLTVTTGSSHAENITVTLNGVAHTIAVTNSGSTVKTAYEISIGTYTGFTAEQVGSTVIFVAGSAGNKTGSFSVSGTSVVGSFAETLQGVASTDTWYAQADWNGADKLDGNGPSGATLDPTKGNVFQIGIQYLGFGSITFAIEAAYAGNNPDFINVHTIRYPNTASTPHVTQPSFPFTMSSYSAGSTTDVSVSVSSFFGGIEGDIMHNGPRHALVRDTNGFVGSTASTYYPLFTMQNSREFGGRANQAVVNIRSISGAHDDATPVTFYLLRDATLVGTPNFTAFGNNSSVHWDVAATSCTISDNDQIVLALQLGQNSSAIHEFIDEHITLQPGEKITLAARAVTGTATYVNGSVNVREDQ